MSDIDERYGTAQWNMVAGRLDRYIVTVQLTCKAGRRPGCVIADAFVVEIDSFDVRSGGQKEIQYSNSWHLTGPQVLEFADTGFSIEHLVGQLVREPISIKSYSDDIPNFDALINLH